MFSSKTKFGLIVFLTAAFLVFVWMTNKDLVLSSVGTPDSSASEISPSVNHETEGMPDRQRPEFTPFGLEASDVPLIDRQELGQDMRDLFDKVESDEVKKKARAALESFPQPREEELASIRKVSMENGVEGFIPKLREVFGDRLDPAVVEQVRRLQDLEDYRRERLGVLYYAERSIDWPTFLAASIMNADMTAKELAQIFSPGDFERIVEARDVSDYHETGKSVFMPPHPSEIFTHFPDIVQYKEVVDGRSQPVILTDGDLAHYVAPEISGEVLRLESQKFMAISQLPEDVSSTDRSVRTREIVDNFHTQAYTLLGDQGYKIFFGEEYQKEK